MHCARLAVVVLALVASDASAAGELTVSAAASLTDAFKEIGRAFDAAHPGTQVRFNFGASGGLLQQVAAGAPVDVLATADQETMDRAESRHLLRPGTRTDFTSNALVLVVPRDATTVPSSLADLAAPAVRRSAIGVPASVPAGRYAKGALESARLWPQVEAKAIGAQSVRQALDYVARGEVDAGFVYATDAAAMPGRVRVAFVVPTVDPIRYPIAVVAASENAAEAERFVAFVGAPPGQAILRRFGFTAP
jgi:molybdate transport system substrate-binding protein